MLAAIGPLSGAAQNLVENGGFETFTECPTNVAQIDRATGWEVDRLSPDYFHACGNNSQVDVPVNFLGHRTAWEGDGYAGMISYADSDLVEDPDPFREFIGRPLSRPLVPGEPVYISARFAPSVGGFGISMKWAASGIGLRFTHGPLDLSDSATTFNSAALHLSEVLQDTSTWTLLSGVYVPDSAYDHVIIGNFFGDAQVTKAVLDPIGNYSGAYTYVDAVCVARQPGICDMSTAMLELERPALHVFPNPCSSRATLLFETPVRGPVVYQLMDELGRVHRAGWLKAGDRSVEGLSVGAYHLMVTAGGQVLANTRLCVVP